MPIAAAMANPTTYRFMLCPASDRKSDVGQTSQARSATSLAGRYEDRVRGSRPELPDAQGDEKDEHAECVAAEAASDSRTHCVDRSSPAQKSVRRWTARSPTLTR